MCTASHCETTQVISESNMCNKLQELQHTSTISLSFCDTDTSRKCTETAGFEALDKAQKGWLRTKKERAQLQLWSACKVKSTSSIKELVAQGADVNSTTFTCSAWLTLH